MVRLGRGEGDAGELLVRALDQIVGGIALSRYAASHTSDNALRGVFQRLVALGEAQEKLVRQNLGRAGEPVGATGWAGAARPRGGDARATALQAILGVLAVGVGFGAALVAARAYRAGTIPAWLLPAWLRPEEPHQAAQRPSA